MVATEQKCVAGPAPDRLHAATIGLDARSLWIVKAPAVHRTPEIGVELEVAAAPFRAHRPEYRFKMCLRARMCTVDRVPRTATPSAESHAIGPQRRAGVVFDEPVGMLCEQFRFGFGDERRDPDGRLETLSSNRIEHRSNIAAKCGSGVEPIAHCALIAIVDLDVLEPGILVRDHVKVVQHLLCGDTRAEAIPGAPTGWRTRRRERRVVA